MLAHPARKAAATACRYRPHPSPRDDDPPDPRVLAPNPLQDRQPLSGEHREPWCAHSLPVLRVKETLPRMRCAGNFAALCGRLVRPPTCRSRPELPLTHLPPLRACSIVPSCVVSPGGPSSKPHVWVCRRPPGDGSPLCVDTSLCREWITDEHRRRFCIEEVARPMAAIGTGLKGAAAIPSAFGGT